MKTCWPLIHFTLFVLLLMFAKLAHAHDKQIIVKFDSAEITSTRYQVQSELPPLSAKLGASLGYVREMAGGSHVLSIPTELDERTTQNLLEQINQTPGVKYALYNRRVFPMKIPTDPYFVSSAQWNLGSTTEHTGATDTESAWDLTTGSSQVTIAIIDTGILPNHEDIRGRVADEYDFISETFTANDGDGRDDDATDPGDWISADETQGGLCPEGDSSWHGTHVTGIIAANTNNATGIAGINWESDLLIARVLGKCGGLLSDIIDAIYWSAGLAVPNVPPAKKPAKVINLSLGMQGACGAAEQAAIDAAVAAGSVVITAAGNSSVNTDSTPFTPASCNNVINVAAFNKEGNRALYSNYGSAVDIVAPGGMMNQLDDPNGILSTLDSGITFAQNDYQYTFYHGTSMAAPHVAGAASLILSIDHTLTPGEVENIITSSARALPADSNCAANQCGSGLLNTYAALSLTANGAPIANPGSNQAVAINSTVTLDGSQSVDSDNGTLVRYLWTQRSGDTVTLDDPSSAVTTFLAPAANATLVFELTVEDDTGNTAQNQVTITVGDNDEPIALENSLKLKKNSIGTGYLSGNDSNGDALTYYISTAPGHGSVTVTDSLTGAYQYTADPGFTGYDTFYFQVSDGKSESEPGKVSITVTKNHSNQLGLITLPGILVLFGIAFCCKVMNRK